MAADVHALPQADERKRGPRHPAKPTSRLVPAQQAADEYGLPYTSLRKLHHIGQLPVVKLGRAWFVKRADLDALIERSTERMAG
jgi:hypothetical protein